MILSKILIWLYMYSLEHTSQFVKYIFWWAPFSIFYWPGRAPVWVKSYLVSDPEFRRYDHFLLATGILPRGTMWVCWTPALWSSTQITSSSSSSRFVLFHLVIQVCCVDNKFRQQILLKTKKFSVRIIYTTRNHHCLSDFLSLYLLINFLIFTYY